MIENATLLRAAADQIDALDSQIAALNDSKKDVYADIRETVAPEVFKAFKDALKLRRRRRDNRDAVEAHETLVDEVLTALEAIGTLVANARVHVTQEKAA